MPAQTTAREDGMVGRCNSITIGKRRRRCRTCGLHDQFHGRAMHRFPRRLGSVMAMVPLEEGRHSLGDGNGMATGGVSSVTAL